jgi:16S rRNA G966 N2-methylase RsmD
MLLLEENGLSTIYLDPPYLYNRIDLLTVLYKNDEAIYLSDEEEIEFYIKCIQAKKQGRSITEVMKKYFPN